MSDNLSELDELIESDVLEALGEKVTEDSTLDIDEITIEDLGNPDDNEASIEDILNSIPEETSTEIPLEETLEDINETEEIELPIEKKSATTINTTDLASLLSELLNNKTIEITIKIKD